MDMRVKMILDLIANTRGGARQAKADIKGVRDAAKGLDGVRGGQKISRDFLNLASGAKTAARGVKDTKAAVDGLGASSGAKKLARDLDQVGNRAARARREIAQMKTAEGRQAARLAAQARRARRNAAEDGAGTTLFGGTKALVGGYLGVQGARMAGRATVGQSISFEKAMAEVQKKVDGMDDPAALQKMEQAVSKWAIAYGRAREEVAGLVAEAGAGGVTLKDMPEFVRVNLAAATAWDVSADKAGNALAKIRAATQWGNKELELFVDKVNALSDAGAAKEMDVVDMFQRAGAAAKAAGVDFDMSLAFLTAMNNVAIAPEVAARGFNAFASTLRTATEQQDRVDEGLKMIGLSAKKVEKGMKANAASTMIDVLERLEKSSDKAKVAIKVFGKEWWDEVARAGQALPEIRKNIDIVTDPKKHVGSAQNSLNIELRTTDKHLKRLSALTSEVGDKLGRWALPAINEGVERIIAGMEAVEKFATDRDKARADRATEDATAGRVADGAALTPAERERMANDALYRQRIEAGAAGKRVDKSNLGLTDNLRLGELEREREQLGASIEARRKAGATDEQLAYSVNRLAALADQIGAIDPSRAPARKDPRRPADQDERGQADRGEAMALRERVLQLEARLAAIDSLRRLSGNRDDRLGYAADAEPHERRRNQADQALRNRIAPNATAAGRFGFGPGGAPASAQPKGAGPGTSSFGLSVKDWAKSLIGAGDIDLGGAGITIAESLAAGLRQGGASAESAASGIRSSITGAFGGADLSGAGAAMMGSLERGITAGGDRAVAAAQRVAARVKAAAASGAVGGSNRLSGALHDGVE